MSDNTKEALLKAKAVIIDCVLAVGPDYTQRCFWCFTEKLWPEHEESCNAGQALKMIEEALK